MLRCSKKIQRKVKKEGLKASDFASFVEANFVKNDTESSVNGFEFAQKFFKERNIELPPENLKALFQFVDFGARGKFDVREFDRMLFESNANSYFSRFYEPTGLPTADPDANHKPTKAASRLRQIVAPGRLDPSEKITLPQTDRCQNHSQNPSENKENISFTNVLFLPQFDKAKQRANFAQVKQAFLDGANAFRVSNPSENRTLTRLLHSKSSQVPAFAHRQQHPPNQRKISFLRLRHRAFQAQLPRQSRRQQSRSRAQVTSQVSRKDSEPSTTNARITGQTMSLLAKSTIRGKVTGAQV